MGLSDPNRALGPEEAAHHVRSPRTRQRLARRVHGTPRPPAWRRIVRAHHRGPGPEPDRGGASLRREPQAVGKWRRQGAPSERAGAMVDLSAATDLLVRHLNVTASRPWCDGRSRRSAGESLMALWGEARRGRCWQPAATCSGSTGHTPDRGADRRGVSLGSAVSDLARRGFRGPAQPTRTMAFRFSGCRPMHRRSSARTFRGRSTSGSDSIARHQRAHRAHVAPPRAPRRRDVLVRRGPRERLGYLPDDGSRIRARVIQSVGGQTVALPADSGRSRRCRARSARARRDRPWHESCSVFIRPARSLPTRSGGARRRTARTRAAGQSALPRPAGSSARLHLGIRGTRGRCACCGCGTGS